MSTHATFGLTVAQIFSINTIVPMISVVYWQNEFPTRYRLGLNLATLFGSMLGQVVLGYFADRLGRRKVYGPELFFTIFASLGLATASTGAFGSMSLIGLLIFWRAVMGIGIGRAFRLCKTYVKSQLTVKKGPITP